MGIVTNMGIKLIKGKQITKFDTKKLANNPNFDVSKLQKPTQKKVVNGNLKENYEDDVYGERKHFYTPDSNGNLQMEQLMGKLMNKLDNIPGNSQTGTNAIEVDIKREIAIGKVDTSAVKSEEFVGKVKTKKDKLKALRNRRK
tara:strand:- start:2696 stop:3124 length:429 start_codon:yes stop_codon:yes gene_type:complete